MIYFYLNQIGLYVCFLNLTTLLFDGCSTVETEQD